MKQVSSDFKHPKTTLGAYGYDITMRMLDLKRFEGTITSNNLVFFYLFMKFIVYFNFTCCSTLVMG